MCKYEAIKLSAQLHPTRSNKKTCLSSLRLLHQHPALGDDEAKLVGLSQSHGQTDTTTCARQGLSRTAGGKFHVPNKLRLGIAVPPFPVSCWRHLESSLPATHGLPPPAGLPPLTPQKLQTGAWQQLVT